MITDEDRIDCRKMLLRYGKFTDDNIDAILKVAEESVIHTHYNPSGSDLVNATALIVSLSNDGISAENIKESIEQAIKNIYRGNNGAF